MVAAERRPGDARPCVGVCENARAENGVAEKAGERKADGPLFPPTPTPGVELNEVCWWKRSSAGDAKDGDGRPRPVRTKDDGTADVGEEVGAPSVGLVKVDEGSAGAGATPLVANGPAGGTAWWEM